MKIRVYYEDTDCGGVVYYANYLRYFERARTEYLRERGIEVAEFAQKGILFVVSHVEARYRGSARYNDLLRIETEISEVGRASFGFFHRIFLDPTGKVLVEGGARLVCVAPDGRPRRLPDSIFHILSQSATGTVNRIED